MIKRTILYVFTVFLILHLPLATCTIDTSSYDSLLTNLTQVRADYDTATNRYDFETAITYKNEIEKYEAKLNKPKFQFLSTYVLAELPIEESNYLLGQMQGIYSDSTLSDLESAVADISDRLLAVEGTYESGDYEAAISQIDSFLDDSAKLPYTVISSAIDSIEAIRQELKTESRLTPSSSSMLDNGAKILKESRTIYYDFEQAVITGKVERSLEMSSAAHEKTTEAFALVKSAKEDLGLLDDIKLILILGPIALIIALIIFFKLSFKKMVVSSTLTQKKNLMSSGVSLERKIILTNPENSTVYMNVADFPPTDASSSDFNIDPNESSGDLVWDLEMGPKDRRVLVYTLLIPREDSKETIKMDPPDVMYELDGKQKKFEGKSNKIKIK